MEYKNIYTALQGLQELHSTDVNRSDALIEVLEKFETLLNTFEIEHEESFKIVHYDEGESKKVDTIIFDCELCFFEYEVESKDFKMAVNFTNELIIEMIGEWTENKFLNEIGFLNEIK